MISVMRVGPAGWMRLPTDCRSGRQVQAGSPAGKCKPAARALQLAAPPVSSPGNGTPPEPQTMDDIRAPKVSFVSLGCPKALVDSERIITRLRAEGYELSREHVG